MPSAKHSQSEAAVLAQCKYLLRLLRNQGKLTWRRISTTGVPRGTGASLRFSKNIDQIGMTDLMVFLPEGKTLHVECKSATGVMSENQKQWEGELQRFGHPYVVVRSAEELVEALRKAGVEVPLYPAMVGKT